MKEMIVQIGDGVPDDQLSRVTNGELIRCRNCANFDNERFGVPGMRLCWKWMIGVEEDKYCSWAERRTDV